MEYRKKRIIWFDAVRVIAIYFVVVIHNYVTSPVFNPFEIAVFAVLQTAVPLFVMISGALLLSKTETYTTFFNKRLKKVVIPWIIWTFVYMAWQIEVGHHALTSISQFKSFFEVTLLTQLWFLPMIVGIYLITPILRVFIRTARFIDMAYFCIIWFIVFSLAPYLHPGVTFPSIESGGLPLQVLLFVGYFFLGYVLNTLKLSKTIVVSAIVISIIGVLLTIIDGYNLFSHRTSALNINNSLPGMVMVSMGIFLCIKMLITSIESKLSMLASSVITALAYGSFGVYLIHQLVMWTILPHFQSLRMIIINPIFTSLLVGLLFYVISSVIIFYIRKIPVVKNVVP